LSFFSKKDQAAKEVGRLEGRLESLEAENISLKEQIKQLQDVLLATRSPDAHKLKKELEYAADTDSDQQEAWKEYEADRTVYEKLIQMQEGRLFSEPKDLYDMLGPMTNAAGMPPPEARADNDES
jgi:chromosome segregation ATPase